MNAPKVKNTSGDINVIIVVSVVLIILVALTHLMQMEVTI